MDGAVARRLRAVRESAWDAPVTPTERRPAGAFWAYVGLHGGAGVSTLLEAVPGGMAFAARSLPSEYGYPDLPIVAVTRSNADGLSAAQDFSREMSMRIDKPRILGLIVMADAATRPPKPLETLLRLASGGYERTWRAPWVEAWRRGEPVSLATLPLPYRRITWEISQLAGVFDIIPELPAP